MDTYYSSAVAELDLKYLWLAKGRGGVKYPNYRRDGRRIELTTPDGTRIVGDKDVAAITEAWTRINATFGAELEKAPARTRIGSIGHGAAVYKASGEFAEKSPATKRDYGRMLDWFVSEHGHRDWADFTREAVLLIRDDNKDRPSWANHMIDIIGVVGTFVSDRPKTFHLPRGWQNPASRVKHLKTGEGHTPWEEHQIEQFREEWSWVCFERVVFETYLNTDQRTSDVRKMMRSHYRKGEISVAQEKTNERVWIPTLSDLKGVLDPWLDSYPSTHNPFFSVHNGRNAMAASHLQTVMRDAMTMAGLPDTCTLHGLRYTFATRAIEAGLDYQTIESIVGHKTIEMAYKYTEKRRKSRLAVVTLDIALKEYRDRWPAGRGVQSQPIDTE